MNLIRIMLFSILTVVLVGCAGQKGTSQDDGAASAGGAADGASSSGYEDDGYGEGSSFDEGASGGVPENRTIYFGYDLSDVTPASMELLSDHAQYLADNPNVAVRLEGHADERGSREYNIGLGERRAQAVRQVLLLRGIASGEMATVSYGEERPATVGSDDESWALNRRVELVYLD
jgi:peptidoglycan-associated lipoprotein